MSFNVTDAPDSKWYNKVCELSKNGKKLGNCHYYGDFIAFFCRIFCIQLVEVKDLDSKKVYHVSKKDFDNLHISDELKGYGKIGVNLKDVKKGSSDKAWTFEGLLNSEDGDEIYEQAKDIGYAPDRIQLMERAAQLNHPLATREVASNYLYGYSVVEKNIDKAIEWYNKAVAAGNYRAYADLGNIYWNGIEGYIEADKVKGRQFFIEAAKSGDFFTIKNGRAERIGRWNEKDINEFLK